MTVSTSKIKVIAFRGSEPIRCKIEIDGKILERLKHVNYLGNDITYGCDRHVYVKIGKFRRYVGLSSECRGTKLGGIQTVFYKIVASLFAIWL